MSTYSPKASEITRAWHVIDAEGMVLGRLCTEAARILRGKHKTTFAPHIDTGDHVIIVNADKVVLTSGKADVKRVYRYSGYPGGLKSERYSDLLGRNLESIRMIAPDVGGGFGPKAPFYAEEAVIPAAAMKVGRPVKWTAERSESFMADAHGRDHVTHAELATDSSGRITGMRVRTTAAMGAYLSTFASCVPTYLYATLLSGQYDIPAIYCEVDAVYTNTVPVDAYRGAGRPEATFVVERLVEVGARELGLEPGDLRKKNFITAFPHQTPVIMNYDSGDFPALFERAISAADWSGFAARKEESRKRGRLRGRGISNFLEVTAPPGKEQGGIRFEPDGTVTIITGTLDYGQGHATPFAQVLSRQLGVPFDKIRLDQGDSDHLLAGGGTGDAAIMLAQQLADAGARQARVTYLDASTASRRIEMSKASAIASEIR